MCSVAGPSHDQSPSIPRRWIEPRRLRLLPRAHRTVQGVDHARRVDRLCDEAVPMEAVVVCIDDRVEESAHGCDDGNRPVLHRLHLGEATRLEATRHHDEIRTGEQPVRERPVESVMEPDVVRILVDQAGRPLRHPCLPGPQQRETEWDVPCEAGALEGDVDALLVHEAGDHRDDRVLRLCPPEFRGEVLTTGDLPRHVADVVPGCDVGIRCRVPTARVDAVPDPDQSVTELPQLRVQAESTLGSQDVGGVGRADGDDPVRELDRPRQGVRAAVRLEEIRSDGDPAEPAPRGPPLVTEGVDRQDLRDRHIEQAECGGRVPVVAVEDVRSDRTGERGDGSREREEPVRVVRPAGTRCVRVRVWLRDAGNVDQGDLTDAVDHTPARCGGCSPARDVEGNRLLALQRDT